MEKMTASASTASRRRDRDHRGRTVELRKSYQEKVWWCQRENRRKRESEREERERKTENRNALQGELIPGVWNG